MSYNRKQNGYYKIIYNQNNKLGGRARSARPPKAAFFVAMVVWYQKSIAGGVWGGAQTPQH